MKTTMSEYDQQAADFLKNYGVTLTIKRAKDKRPGWAEPGDPHGNRYRVTLTHPDRQPLRFNFWGSINDRAKGEDLTAYSVLACISGDVNCPETFAEFCAEYGYDEDSRKALATFKRCDRFGRQIRAFFSDEPEREALAEIS